MTSLPPLSLYIHIPWCIRKCPYCDFNSHQINGQLPETAYVDALLADLDGDSLYIQDRPLQSIFIGGGTPSLMSAPALERLLEGVDRYLPISENVEITLEANPGTFEQDKFSDYRKLGINRLSIGIQSFQQRFLEKLGRVHNDKEALRATEIAHKAGFDNLNLDLMFGLPEQSKTDALADLNTAIGLGPSHLSWYQLTVEPNTEFYRRPPVQPSHEEMFNMQEIGQVLLEDAGFGQYEVSAYSQPGRRSRHNLNYWQFGDYLGIGAGAHGKITVADSGAIIRTRKTRQPEHYLDPNRIVSVDSSPIPRGELPLEFMMNAMRLLSGSDAATFESHTGLDFSVIVPVLEQVAKQGLVDLEGQRFRPSRKGLLFHNDMMLAFMD